MTYEAFGWFAAITSGLRSVPQVVRLWGGQTVAGVSAASMAFTSMNGLAWVIWSADSGNDPVLLSSALTFAGFLEVARRTRQSLSSAERLTLAGAALLYSATFFAFGPSGLGVLASVGSTVQFIPQAREVLRATDHSGVASGTYVLATLNESSWLVYAAVTREPLLALPYLVRLPTSLFILAVAWHQGRRREHPGKP